MYQLSSGQRTLVTTTLERNPFSHLTADYTLEANEKRFNYKWGFQTLTRSFMFVSQPYWSVTNVTPDSKKPCEYSDERHLPASQPWQAGLGWHRELPSAASIAGCRHPHSCIHGTVPRTQQKCQKCTLLGFKCEVNKEKIVVYSQKTLAWM